MRLIFVIIALLFCAGLFNGIADSLQFHYSSSFAKSWNSEYWNPAISWKAKYAQENGDLIRPLKPRFWGSTTVLVWVTDAWHLAKFLYHAFLRLAVVYLFLTIWRALQNESWNWYQYAYMYVGAWLALAAVQAAGFHVFYTLI